MMYTYKLIFLMILMLGTFISISSYTWMGTWMGLEINLLSFIPLLKKNKDLNSSESSIKYFLVQAMTSMVFLLSILLITLSQDVTSESFNMNMFMMMLTNSTLLLKMGAAPFHFWFTEIVEYMNWNNILLLMTWQKIAPMMLLSYTIKFSNYIYFIIIISTFVGSIGGLNQTSMRKLMAYSSINHIGWMISAFMVNYMMWMIYFMIYSMITIAIIMMFNFFKIYYMKQMYSFMNMKIKIKFILMMNLMSLGGLPPFLGFMPKWMIIQSLSMNYIFLTLFMILMTLITLFFYIRIMYPMLVINQNELNFNMNSNNFKMKNMISILSFISINGLIMLTLSFNIY